MSQDTQFLQRAIALHENSFNIIPIPPSSKAPVEDGWQKTVATNASIKHWASNGYANGNIGILTAHHPAIDLDILDKEVGDIMEAWCLEQFGDTCVRVGRAPKRLLVFYASEPFKKQYVDLVDELGVKHRVEVLADGQQFVAYGIHPDTKKPFSWVSIDEPTTTDAMMLPELTADDATRVIDKFIEVGQARGWTIKKTASRGVATRSMVVSKGDDDALLSFKPTVNLSPDDIAAALKFITDSDDYDRWIQIGMALHHQFHGDTDGMEMWREWSSTAANYDPDAIETHWASFDTAPTSHNAVTAATIIKLANDARQEQAQENFERVLNVIRTAKDEHVLFGAVAKEVATHANSPFQLDVVTKKMQDRAFEITGVKPRLDTIRKALIDAKPKAKEGSGGMPPWCQDWVYLQNGDRFYNVRKNIEVTEKGFNATYNREVVKPEDIAVGNAIPACNASTLALNTYKIPLVVSLVYLPGHAKLVEFEGKLRANTFDESTVPTPRKPKTAADHAILAAIDHHFNILFEDEVERQIVIDYLAYNIQYPMEKIIWGIVMQGGEGAGKSWVQLLMSALLGPQNVLPITAKALQDNFTGWAEGAKMVFFEEIRLHGENRYAILDSMKEFVTNEVVTIRRMNKERYRVPNVTNYFMYTNYWDALPLSTMDRRYFVASTSFQTREELDDFMLTDPDHFATIYDAVYNHGDLLRYHFMTKRISDLFHPKKPALDSFSKRRMRDSAESGDDMDVLNNIIENSNDPQLSEKLLNLDRLREYMADEGKYIPKNIALKGVLMRAGFHLVGRFRLDKTDAQQSRFYTKTPKLFRRNRELEDVRSYLAALMEDDGI